MRPRTHTPRGGSAGPRGGPPLHGGPPRSHSHGPGGMPGRSAAGGRAPRVDTRAQQVQSALALALNSDEAPDVRAAALGKLLAWLAPATGWRPEAPLALQLLAAWPQMVSLLWDPHPAVQQAAGPLVGALGAAAALLPPSPPGPAHGTLPPPPLQSMPPPPPGLVFDWLLPLLLGQLGPGGHQATVAAQAAMCAALAATLRLLPTPSPTTDACASGVVEALRQLLESEDTPPQLLAPLLALLRGAVAASGQCVEPHMHDLSDLLLGWCLDPGAGEADRRHIADVFVALRPGWERHSELATLVAGKLLSDIEAGAQLAAAGLASTPAAVQETLQSAGSESAGVATPAGDAPSEEEAGSGAASCSAPQNDGEQQRCQALASCLAAILQGAATTGNAEELALGLPRLEQALLQLSRPCSGAADAAAAAGAASGCCLLEQALLAVLPLLPPGRSGGSSAGDTSAGGSSAGSSGDGGSSAGAAPDELVDSCMRLCLVTLQLPLLSCSEAAAVADALARLVRFQAAIASLGSGSGAGSAGSSSGGGEQLRSVTEVAAAMFEQPLRELHLCRSAPLLAAMCRLQLALLAVLPLADGPAWRPLLAEVRHLGDSRAPANEGDQATAAAPAAEQSTEAVAAASAGAAAPSDAAGVLWCSPQEAAVLLSADLVVLEAWFDQGACVDLQLPGQGAEDGSVLRPAGSVLSVLAACLQAAKGAMAEQPALCSQAVQVLAAVAGALARAPQAEAVADLQRTLLQCLEAAASEQRPPAVVAAALAAAQQLAPSIRHVPLMQQLLALLQGSAHHPDPRTRLAVVGGLCALARRLASGGVRAGGAAPAGAASPQLQLLAGAVATCLELLTDVHPDVSQAACSAFEVLLAPGALLVAEAQAGQPDPFWPAWRDRGAALRGLQLTGGFKPRQLASFMEWLFQSGPGLLLRKPQADAAAGGAGGGSVAQAQAAMLLQLLQALPPPAATAPEESAAPAAQQQQQPSGQGAGAVPWDPCCLTSLAGVCWFLVHEAASQCVNARMRTHLGAAAQSFAGLEKMLQGLLHRLEQAAAADGPTGRPIVWLMLEFMLALEQGIYNAHEGCCARDAPAKLAVAFFTANRKVCDEWFLRNRGTLLRISAVAGSHCHTAAHGMQRLRDLHTQLRAILAAQRQQKQQAAAAAAAAADAKGRASRDPKKQQRGGKGAADAEQVDHSATAAAATAAAAAALAGLGLTAVVGPPPVPQPQQLLRHAHPQALAAPPSAPLAQPPVQQPQQAQQEQAEAALQRITASALDAVATTAGALLALHEPDAVAGLHAWAREAFAHLWNPFVSQLEIEAAAAASASAAVPASAPDASGSGSAHAAAAVTAAGAAHPLAWLAAVRAQAEGCYEQALAAYMAFECSPGGRLPIVRARLAPWLADRVAECYAALDDCRQLSAHAASTCTAAGTPRFGQQPPVGGAVSPPGAWQGLAFAGPQALQALQQWDAAPTAAGHAPASPAAHLPAAAHALMAAAAALEGSSSSRSAGAPARQLLGRLAAEKEATMQAVAAAAVAGWHGQAQQLQLLLGLQLACQRLAATPGGAAAGLAGAPGRGMADTACAASAAPLAVDALLLLDARLAQPLEAAAVGGGLTLLAADGELRVPSLQDTALLLPLLRSAGGPGGLPGGVALAEEALLLAHDRGNARAVARLLDSLQAAVKSEGDKLQLKLATIHMRLASGSARGGAISSLPLLQASVQEHLGLLAGCWPGSAPASHVPAAAPPSALAWACMSLARLLEAGAATGAAAAAPQLQLGGGPASSDPSLTWSALYTASLQRLSTALAAGSDQGGSGEAVSAQAAQPAAQLPSAALPCAACYAAALAWQPQLAAAWRAYGDFLFTTTAAARAEEGAAPATSSAAASGAGTPDGLQGYVLAAEAYCSYLAAAVNASQLASSEHGLQALLRLLHLVVAHAEALQAPLAAALARCPAAVWQALTPQLFGHLASSSSGAVRPLVQSLLIAVAGAAPSAVLYPAVAELRGAQEAGRGVTAELRAVVAALEAGPGRGRLVRETCELVGQLEGLTVTPQERWHALLSEVELDVGRKLLAVQAEAARLASNPRITTEKRQHLLRRRYDTVMAPVTLLLENHLAAAQAAPPQSANDTRFAESFLPAAARALAAFKDPDTPAGQASAAAEGGGGGAAGGQGSGEGGEEAAEAGQQQQEEGDLGPLRRAWLPLKQLLAALGQELRQARLQLALHAPRVAELASAGRIPMPPDDLAPAPLPPLTCAAAWRASRGASTTTSASGGGDGLSDDGSGGLTLAGVSPDVLVLGTKTRPKRLQLLASDGSRHTFLLKGRDDLRVDERLTQFIRAANAQLECAPAARRYSGAGGGGLRMRHYSVTPLGRRAGLVQWVRHTVSLFGIFRSWQRGVVESAAAVAAASKGAAAPAGGGATAAAAAPPRPLPLLASAARPADAFYAKLLPALQQAGLAAGTARRDWPTDVLRSVLVSLMREAPRQLLARELWCGASHAGGWWGRQQRYALSCAVASIVGWILGIGDRHLDNILLDQASGEVVHIDYSVCFDKGAALRVPEVVPFRLTQMMELGLGVTGVEGCFRAAAEATLAGLRSVASPLVGLLDVVLADSTVDWSAEREAVSAKKDLDVAVSLNLFASRMEEVRGPLLQRLHLLLASAGGAIGALAAYGEAHVYMAAAEGAAQQAHGMAAEAKGQLLAAAAGEAEAAASAREAAAQEAALLSDGQRLASMGASALAECNTWAARHAETLVALGSRPPMHLTAPSAVWSSASCPVLLFLLPPLPSQDTPASGIGAAASGTASTEVAGASGPGEVAGGIVTSALGAAASIDSLPPQLLQQAAALDAQGRQLLARHDEVLTAAMTALLQYGLVLKELLPGYYHGSSHHTQWAHALSAALSPPGAAQQLQPAGPSEPPAAAVVHTWAVLQVAHQATAWQLQRLASEQEEAEQDQQRRQSGEQWSSSALVIALERLAADCGRTEAHTAAAQLLAAGSLRDACGGVLAACEHLQDAAAAPAGPAAAGSAALATALAVPGSDGYDSSGAQQEALAAVQAQLLGLLHVFGMFADAGLSDLIHLAPDAGGVSWADEVEAEEHGLLAASGAAGAGEREAVPLAAANACQWLRRAVNTMERGEQVVERLGHATCDVLALLAAAAPPAEAAGGGGGEAAGGAAAAVAAAHGSEAAASGSGGLWQQVQQQVEQGWQQLQVLLAQGRELDGQLSALASQPAACAAGSAAGGAAPALPAAELRARWSQLDAEVGACLHGTLQPLGAFAAQGRRSSASGGGGAAPGSRSWGSPQLADLVGPLAAALLAAGGLIAAGGAAAGGAEDAAAAEAAAAAALLGALPLDFSKHAPQVFALAMLHGLVQQVVGAAAGAPGSGGGATPAVPLQLTQQLQQVHGWLVGRACAALRQSLVAGVVASLRQMREHYQQAVEQSTRVLQPGSSHTGGARGGAGMPRASLPPQQQQLDGEQGAGGELPPLVAFTGFDAGLPGAGQLLEEDGQLLAETGELLEGELLEGDWLEVEPLEPEAGLLEAGSLGSGAASQAGSSGASQGSQAGSHNGTGAGQGGGCGAELAPELVPFEGFDFNLAGAGELLEGLKGLEGLEGEGLEELGGVMDEVWGQQEEEGMPIDWLEEEEQQDEVAIGADVPAASMQASSRLQAGSGVPAGDEELQLRLQQLSGQVCEVLGSRGGLQAAKQRTAALAGVLAQLQTRRREPLRHLAAFEWLNAELLPAAATAAPTAEQGGGAGDAGVATAAAALVNQAQAAASQMLAALGGAAGELPPQPVQALPLGEAFQLFFQPQHLEGSSSSTLTPAAAAAAPHMPCRADLLATWQRAVGELGELSPALATWQSQAAGAVSRLQQSLAAAASARAHGGGGGAAALPLDPGASFKVFQALMAQQRQWTRDALRVSDGVAHLCEAAVQFECSRRGRLWTPGSSAQLDAFQGNAQLLAQLRAARMALDAVRAREEAAQAAAADWRARGAMAQAALAVAGEQQGAAVAQLVSHAGAMIARAQALAPSLPAAVEGVQAALPLIEGEVSGVLRELQRVAEHGAAARDLAPLLQGARDAHGRVCGLLATLQQLAGAVGAKLSEEEALSFLQQPLATLLAPAAAGAADSWQQQQQELQQRVLQHVYALLQHLGPLIKEHQEQLAELTRVDAHLRDMCHQLDALTAAASTVAGAIQADHIPHALPAPAHALAGLAGDTSAAGAEAVAGSSTSQCVGGSQDSTQEGGTGASASPGVAGAGIQQEEWQASPSAGATDGKGSQPQASGRQGASGGGAPPGQAAASRGQQHGRTEPGTAQGLGGVPSSSSRAQRAEARHRAFARYALQRCSARLGAPSAGGGVGSAAGDKPAAPQREVSEQVAQLISAGTSVDNLCRMFEGWTPWL